MNNHPKALYVQLMMESMLNLADTEAESLSALEGQWKDFMSVYQLYHGRYLINSIRRSMIVEPGESGAVEVSLTFRAAIRFFELKRGLIDLFRQCVEESVFVSTEDGESFTLPSLTAVSRMCDPVRVAHVAELAHKLGGSLTFAALGNLAFFQNPSFRREYVHACR